MKLVEIFQKVVDAINIVEEKKEEFTSSESKKEYAVEMIDKIVDIPFFPDKLVIGFVVDMAVFVFNKYNLFGRDKG